MDLIFNGKKVHQLERCELDNLLHFVHRADFYLLQNGKKIQGKGAIGNTPIHIVPRLVGGKGGFGSMLRAIGAQIEKTTNREACRDLSGRRLRDINEEKRLKKWLAEKPKREKEAEERKKKKLEKLKQEPKHEFSDPHYDMERSVMIEKVYSAVEEGLKAATETSQPSSSQGVKRKDPPTKKGLLWVVADDLPSDVTDSSDEEDNGEKEAKKSKVC